MTTLRLTIDIDLDDSADPQTITDQAAGRIWSLKGVKQGGDAVKVVRSAIYRATGCTVVHDCTQEVFKELLNPGRFGRVAVGWRDK